MDNGFAKLANEERMLSLRKRRCVMVRNSFSRFDFWLPVGRKTINQSEEDWFVGVFAKSLQKKR